MCGSCAGIPIPNLAELIPKEWDSIACSIAHTLGLTQAQVTSGQSAAEADVTGQIQTQLSRDDAAIVDAVVSGRVGNARMRPAVLQGDQLAQLCTLFNMPDTPKVRRCMHCAV